MDIYRIGVRRFFFFWKIYKVVGHATEVLGGSARMVLRFPDESRLAIPRIDRKVVRVYPELQHQQDKAAAAPPREPFPE